MDKSLENEIVFTNLNGKYIIKCECLDILKYYSESPIYNIDFANYYCDKVRIIELYDTNKNIINFIIDPSYNDTLKIGLIISLESFKENICLKQNHYFKTFLGAYIYINKLNNIEYNLLNTGEIIGFKNDIIEFNSFYDFLKFKKNDYYTYFYNNNNKVTHCINSNRNYFNICYFLYNKFYNYKIKIYSDGRIEILKLQKVLKVDYHQQIIICNKKLKILQVLEQNWSNILYEENRDINGVIIDIKKYNLDTGKLETILSKKSEKKFPQELLDFYYSKINFLYSLIHIKNVELDNARKILLNEIFKKLSIVSI